MSASFSEHEFELMRRQENVTLISDTLQPHAKFGPDILLRHVKLKFRSESAWGFMRAISDMFVYCPDGRVRLQRDLDQT
jgi:hypothetical protein